jgi:hypothetical protein
MVYTRRLTFLSILVASAALAVGYGAGGYLREALILAALGGVWLAGLRLATLRPRWNWLHSLALLLYTVAAGLGMLLRLPPGWMLAGLVGAVSAWDLEYFARRVRSVGEEVADRRLERQHLVRLAVVMGAGMAAAGGALLLRARFRLGVGLLAGLVALLALTQVIGFLRRESD